MGKPGHFIPLPLARARERLRYLTLATEICGGSVKLTASALGFNRRTFSQYVERCLTEIRHESQVRQGRESVVRADLPRVRRPVWPVKEQLFATLVPLRQHMNDWEREYIRKAIAACDGSWRQASVLLGLNPNTLYSIVQRRHLRLDDPRPARRRQADSAEWWTGLLMLFRLLTACSMVGISLLPVGNQPAPIQVVRKEDE